MASGGIEWFEPPIVEDEEMPATERALDAGIAAIAACERPQELQPEPADRSLLVKPLKQFTDRRVELGEAAEATVVARPAWPGRQHEPGAPD
jgi:hypothetical protein